MAGLQRPRASSENPRKRLRQMRVQLRTYLGRRWFKPRTQMVQTSVADGSNLGRRWFKPLAQMVQTSDADGSNLGRGWFKPLSRMVQTSTADGSNLYRGWFKPLPQMVQTAARRQDAEQTLSDFNRTSLRRLDYLSNRSQLLHREDTEAICRTRGQGQNRRSRQPAEAARYRELLHQPPERSRGPGAE